MTKFILLIALILPSISFSASSPKCPGEKGYYYTNDKSKRNPRKGGFVGEGANVGDYVFIAPTAAVCGSASILKFARVYGSAVVKDEAEVTDKARVYGNAVISGEAIISGDAKVSGHASVSSSAVIKGSTRVKGYAVISKGTYINGTHDAVKPKWIAKQERAKTSKINAVADSADQKTRLKRFQRDLDQGWYGTDKRKGFYRNFKFTKSDIKLPCGFYLKLQKEEKVLDSHCRKTKRVRRKLWTPKGGNWKTITNCTTDYDDQGEKFFNLKALNLKTHHDFTNNKAYLDFNGYFFYVGNKRRIKEFKEKLIAYAKQYCGHR